MLLVVVSCLCDQLFIMLIQVMNEIAMENASYDKCVYML